MAYPMLAAADSTYVIGPNIHNVLIARELLKRGFKVCFITHGNGGKPVEKIDGIEIIKVYSELDAYRMGRFSKALEIWKALKAARADIYYQQEGAFCLPSVFCRRHGKKSVTCIASDAWVSDLGDWFKRKFSGFQLFNRLSYELETRLADAVIVMNEYQLKMLKKNFSRDGLIIRHHIPLTSGAKSAKKHPPLVIWVGTVNEIKQPGLFVKLAEAVPQADFELIGGYFPEGKQDYERLKEAAQKAGNCTLVGFIPFQAINEYFARAAILVNTSRTEAYPPFAFLQAWMHYTPVVSLHDNSEEILTRHEMGLHSGSFEKLVEDVRSLVEDESLRQRLGENGRRYVEQYYDPHKIIGQYVDLFNGMMSK